MGMCLSPDPLPTWPPACGPSHDLTSSLYDFYNILTTGNASMAAEP